MARRLNEVAVIDRFLNHLADETGDKWQASPDEMPTLKNNRSYDCEFTCPPRTAIAADICALFPVGSHPTEQAKRAGFIDRMIPALEREGIGGLMLNLPPIQKKHVNPAWPKQAAAKIRQAVELLPPGTEVEVEGFTVRRVADNSESSFFVHSDYGAHQPVEGAGLALVKQLKDKNDQLDVDGHRRFLITVNDGCRAYARDVIAACALIEFRLYPNFDRIYFEESPGRFFLVYDRDAFVSMEAGKLPTDPELRSLVTQWVEECLSGKMPGALETALQISWDLRSIEWLSAGGQTLLELEAHLFLQKCTWKTPRALWELFRGPPGIGDGRRQARRIRAA